MIGDDEGSSRPTSGAAVPISEASVEAGSQTAPVTVSADGTAEREAAGASAFNAVTACLGIAVLILLAAVAYMYSIAPAGDRLATDERTLADLRSQIASIDVRTTAPDLTPIAERVDALEKQFATVKSDIAALQQPPAPPPAPTPDTTAQIGALSAQMPDLQHGLDALRSSMSDVGKHVDASDARLGALENKVGAIPTVDLSPLNARLDRLDAQVKPLVEEAQAAKSPTRVTEVRQNGSGAEARAAPLAVTADAALRAIDAGRPFTDDVKALKNLGADATALQPLGAVAEAGAPTTENLRADLASLRDRMVTHGAAAPTGSYLDRLVAGAQSVVSVRPVGSVPGDTPAAVVARMDDELGRDDLAAALADWQKLPEASRDVSKGLADRIRLRQEAQNAAKAIAAGAIQAMAAAQP